MWIRIFRTENKALKAKKLLEEIGIHAWISHDNLDGVPIEKYGVPPRFRLEIEPRDLNKAARFLAGKLKRGKVSRD